MDGVTASAEGIEPCYLWRLIGSATHALDTQDVRPNPKRQQMSRSPHRLRARFPLRPDSMRMILYPISVRMRRRRSRRVLLLPLLLFILSVSSVIVLTIDLVNGRAFHCREPAPAAARSSFGHSLSSSSQSVRNAFRQWPE